MYQIKSKIISILKHTSNISKLLELKLPDNLKALTIYQYLIKAICNIIPRIALHLDSFQLIQSLLQSITGIGNNAIYWVT